MVRRSAHERTNRYGKTFSVREHEMRWGANPRLSWKGEQAYVNGSIVYRMTCPRCRKPVFFYRNENGSRVFFDALGKPWPKHGCMQGGRKLRISTKGVMPVTRDMLMPEADDKLDAKPVLDMDALKQLSRPSKKQRALRNKAQEQLEKQKKNEAKRKRNLEANKARWEAEGAPAKKPKKQKPFKVEIKKAKKRN